jgi:hypothetical protein
VSPDTVADWIVGIGFEAGCGSAHVGEKDPEDVQLLLGGLGEGGVEVEVDIVPPQAHRSASARIGVSRCIAVCSTILPLKALRQTAL